MNIKIPKYSIEQLNKCDQHIKMNVDIRRLEDHIANMEGLVFPHRHDFYNLVYIVQGSGTHDIDFKRFEVVPNQLFFMNDNQVHEWNLSDDVKGFTMFFKKEFYTVAEPIFSIPHLPFFHNASNEAQMVVFDKNEGEVFEHYFEDILAEFQNGQAHSQAIIKTLLKIMLIKSLRVHQPQYQSSGSSLIHAKIGQFELLIEQHFGAIKGVKDYAAKMNMTPNYLNAICSKALGKTAGEMIRDRVLLEAKRLLIHSPLSVCEMAYSLGYDDCSYFIRMFKKAVGLTPEQYRTQAG